MTGAGHDEIAELLGVYALDAVDADERRLVDAHLSTCPRCRAELREHMEVAAVLGDAGEPAPSGTWDAIAARLGDDDPAAERPATPPLDLTSFRAVGASTTRPRSRRVATAVLGVAAGVFLVAAFATMGWVIADQQSRLDDMETVMEGDSMMLDPDAEVVALADDAGITYATAVMAKNGRAVLIGTGLEPLPEGRSYQLWAVGPDGPVSLGMLGADPRLVPFGMTGHDSMVLAITDEPEQGSPAPTSDPMATGEMTDL
jgi:hypothetical protein